MKISLEIAGVLAGIQIKHLLNMGQGPTITHTRRQESKQARTRMHTHTHTMCIWWNFQTHGNKITSLSFGTELNTFTSHIFTVHFDSVFSANIHG